MAEPEFVRRTRCSYDTVADDYAPWVRDELAVKPLDRVVLQAFAELVRTTGGGAVADIGCGSGRAMAYLDGLGLSVFGIDLSPRLVAVARSSYLGLPEQQPQAFVPVCVPAGSGYGPTRCRRL